MAFDFQDGTEFSSHRDTEEQPKKRGRKKPEPEPEPTPAADVPAKKRKGVPRTGKYPMRKPWHQAKRQRGHDWALSNEWYGKAIRSYSRWGNKTRAAAEAGVARGTLMSRLDADPEFRERMDTAFEEFKDGYLESLDDLALNGDERFTIDKETGERVSLGRTRNVIAMIFRIKQLMPEFRENYKADDAEQRHAPVAMFINYLKQGLEASPDRLDALPSFDEFRSMPAALEGPAEAVPAVDVRSMSPEERRSLMAELAAMDEAEEQP